MFSSPATTGCETTRTYGVDSTRDSRRAHATGRPRRATVTGADSTSSSGASMPSSRCPHMWAVKSWWPSTPSGPTATTPATTPAAALRVRASDQARPRRRPARTSAA